jgi:hypothetical protein
MGEQSLVSCLLYILMKHFNEIVYTLYYVKVLGKSLPSDRCRNLASHRPQSWELKPNKKHFIKVELKFQKIIFTIVMS